MKIKSLSVIAGVGVPLILVRGADAGFMHIDTVVTDAPPTPGLPQGAFVFSLFAHFDRPGQDRFLGVVGTPGSPLSIACLNGSLYQNAFGGDTAPSAALIAVFPSLAYDTFVTIGVKKLGAPGGQPSDQTTLSPGWPGFGPSSLVGSNIGWTVPDGSPQSDPFNPSYVGGNGMVLIAQLTSTNGTQFGGMFRILVVSNNVATQLDLSFLYFSPAPGGLGALAFAGLLGTRRRRSC